MLGNPLLLKSLLFKKELLELGLQVIAMLLLTLLADLSFLPTAILDDGPDQLVEKGRLYLLPAQVALRHGEEQWQAIVYKISRGFLMTLSFHY